MSGFDKRRRGELTAAGAAIATAGLAGCSSDAETADAEESAAETSSAGSEADTSAAEGDSTAEGSAETEGSAEAEGDAEAEGSAEAESGDSDGAASSTDDGSADEASDAADAADSVDEATDAADTSADLATEELVEEVIVAEKEEDVTTLTLTDPAALGIPSVGWAGIGLVAGLAVAAAAYALGRAVRKRGEKAEKPVGSPARQAPMRITVEKVHDQGARESQQDSFYVSADSAEDNLLVIVADGMGGLSDGDKVSQTAVAAAAEAFFAVQDADTKRLLVQVMERANQAVNQLLGYQGLYQSGCTFAIGLARGGRFTYASVGDSRICLVREGELVQLNREHVYQDELYVEFMNGERPLTDADTHPKKAGLTSFMGMGELKYVDLPAEPAEMRAGDRFLLMSDGVYNALPASELLALVEGTQGEGATAAERLHGAIQAKGYRNQDNFTAVILNCE